MLFFNFEKPVHMIWFGKFATPQVGEWKHITRILYEYELMVVDSGVLYIADESKEYVVREGEYLLMSPTRFQHGYRVSKCSFYWLHFEAPTEPHGKFGLPIQGKVTDFSLINRYANQLFKAEATEHCGVYSQYLATAFLLELQEEQRAISLSYKNRSSSTQESLCERIKEYISWHKFSDIKISDLAFELGYHEKYLSAVFHETERITLKRYIMKQRAEEAKRLLQNSDYTIAEISYYLNFQNAHNFSRFFKAETGITANEFRETFKSEEAKQKK